MASSCARIGLDWKLEKISSQEGCQALAQVAQGSGHQSWSYLKGVSCAALGHGLVADLAVLGQWLDLRMLKFFSSLNGSMIR